MEISKSQITAGETILFSAGQFSDYSIHDLGVALTNFNLHEALESYLTEHPEQRKDYDFRPSQFLAYLVLNQFVRTIAYREAFLGAYHTTSNVEMRDQDHASDWGCD